MGLLFPSTLVQPSRTLAGFNLSLVPHLAEELQSRFAHLEDMLGEGTLKAVVGAVLPFEELPRAHALLQGRGSTGKVVMAVCRGSAPPPVCSEVTHAPAKRSASEGPRPGNRSVPRKLQR